MYDFFCLLEVDDDQLSQKPKNHKKRENLPRGFTATTAEGLKLEDIARDLK